MSWINPELVKIPAGWAWGTPRAARDPRKRQSSARIVHLFPTTTVAEAELRTLCGLDPETALSATRTSFDFLTPGAPHYCMDCADAAAAS